MEMKQMNEYDMWLGVRNDMQEAIDRLQREVKVNKIFLISAQKELNKLPKPKKEENILVK